MLAPALAALALVALDVTPASANSADRSTPPSGSADAVGRRSSGSVAHVAAQPCDHPRPRLGVATYLSERVLVTAAHVVDGSLRRLEIDGRRAAVVALDPSRDLAIVRLDRSDASDGDRPAPVRFATTEPAPGRPVTIHTADGPIDATVLRVVTLRVDDVSAGRQHERRSTVLDTLVRPGHSGAPVLDADGGLVGVVVLRDRAAGTSFASLAPRAVDLWRLKALAVPGACA